MIVDKSWKIVLQTQNAVLTSVQKNCRQKLNSFPLWVHKSQKKPCFWDSLVIFSKWSSVQLECTSDEHAELFHQKSNIFLCKVQLLWKNLTLFSGQPIFLSNFVCTRVLHFRRPCQKFWVEHERNSFSNIKSVEKFSKNLLEKNCALELKNAVKSTVCNQGCPQSKCFPLQVPKHMKNYVFFR